MSCYFLPLLAAVFSDLRRLQDTDLRAANIMKTLRGFNLAAATFMGYFVPAGCYFCSSFIVFLTVKYKSTPPIAL